MINYKSEEEIELVKNSSLLVGKTLAEVAKEIQSGVTTRKLDKLAEEYIRDHDAVPAFKGYRGFPNTLCVSRNEAVVHGIPNDKPLEEGEILSVDCGVLKQGFYGDSAFTFEIGEVKEEVRKLLRITKECLNKAIKVAVAGNRLGDIGYAVQDHAENNGYSVVRELVGHGLGKELHESPEVANFGKKGRGIKLKEGLVIAIEPMINMGEKSVRQLQDGWTIITADGEPSAHFEHTVVVRKEKADILSTFKYIDVVLGTCQNI